MGSGISGVGTNRTGISSDVKSIGVPRAGIGSNIKKYGGYTGRYIDL